MYEYAGGNKGERRPKVREIKILAPVAISTKNKKDPRNVTTI
jgi:hypothetical protein